MHKLFTIIVAGGNGIRMSSELPKQFLLLDNEPILMHTIRNFANAVAGALDNDATYSPNVNKIVNNTVVVLPRDYISLWGKLCEEHGFDHPHHVAPGGATRFDSVKAGLAVATDADIIAVHDGVRPFASARLINEAICKAIDEGSAVPAVKPNDSMRRLTVEGSRSVDRNEYRSIQTPQVFRASWIKDAYRAEYREEFTDDASVVESAGYRINLIEGDAENIKLTTPADMRLAELINARICK